MIKKTKKTSDVKKRKTLDVKGGVSIVIKNEI